MNWIPEKTHSILQGNLSQVNAFALAFEGNPDDGNSAAIAAALGASICRSTLGYYPGFPVPQPERNLYYTKPPIFQYAAIIHKYALDNHAFCFGYDEVAQDNGPTNQVWNPTSLAITIRGLT